MVLKANKKLWMIQRIKQKGANLEDMKDVYCKQVRSILEFGVPTWHSRITREEEVEIERVQKSFLHIALGNDYDSYNHARTKLGLETLTERRTKLCESLAIKASKDPKHKTWFKPREPKWIQTRSIKPNYETPRARLVRFETSSIPYLTSLLNK